MASFSGILSGVFTALLLVVFIGIVVWAYSSRRRSTFEDAARLPLEEDSGAIPPGSRQQQS
jgi:cytochrome c oxidase cbb3-type subunit 4